MEKKNPATKSSKQNDELSGQRAGGDLGSSSESRLSGQRAGGDLGGGSAFLNRRRADLRVHLVLRTNHSYPAFSESVGSEIRDIFREVCKNNDLVILKGRVRQDHVYLYLSYSPDWSIDEIVKELKEQTEDEIQENLPQLGKEYWGQEYWASGYAAFSSGFVSEDMITEYLETNGEEPSDDQFEVKAGG